MATATATVASPPKYPIPAGLKLSGSTLKALPAGEKPSAAQKLWDKSGGLCALCSQPLDSDAANISDGLIEPDHVVPKHSGKGGPDVLANLFLAHRHCNRKRGDSAYDLAKRCIAFSVWAGQNSPIHFWQVLGKYVPKANQNALYTRTGDRIALTFPGFTWEAGVAKDPATGVEYFFAEVPVTYIHDDTPVQPRAIEPSQVEDLAEDFYIHPVHEPSNVRMTYAGETVCILSQFDGQHKTTAQIILGRDRVPVKVYIEPPIALLQDLVRSVQDRIRKLRLSTSDTLAKLGDVMKARLDDYKVPPGEVRTEQGFVDSRPPDQRKRFKAEYVQELQRIILNDPSNKLRGFAAPKATPERPLTDKVLVEKLIKPFIYPQLLTENMDEPGGRDNEQKVVLLVLNTIVDELIAKGWAKGSSTLDRRRATNFMYQGSIGWWLPQLLKPAIYAQLRVRRTDETTRLLKSMSSLDVEDVRQLVIALVNWPIWSHDPGSPEVAAMRSNTPKRVAAAFPGYSQYTLLDDARNNP
jgi:HNH endonuclease